MSVIIFLHPRKFPIHLLFNSLFFNFIFLSYNSLIVMLTFLFKLSFCNLNWVAKSNLFLVQYVDCLRNTLNLLKADDSIAFYFVFIIFVETNLLLASARIKTNYTAWCDKLLYFFHRNIIRKTTEIYAWVNFGLIPLLLFLSFLILFFLFLSALLVLDLIIF